MSSNDFFALVDKYKKKKPLPGYNNTQNMTVSGVDHGSDDEFWKLVQKYQTERDFGFEGGKIQTIKRFGEADPAPSKPKKDEDGIDFFQKGSFEDGFDWHDIPSAILGTAGDAGLNVVKGLAGLGEGIGDLLGYGIAGVADLAGKDEYAEGVRERASINLTDKFTKGAEDYLNQYSVLGKTSDAILQGVGQVGGIIATGGIGSSAGLGAGGVSALTTGMMGLSGMGSGMGEAYQSGATDGEALVYGASAGAADAVWELMFGGMGKAVNALGFSRGLSSLDDIAAKGISKFISSPTGKNIVEAVVKGGFEGLEEVGAGFTQAVAKKLTYMSEEDFGKILKDEDLLEQFLVGAMTSGIMQSPSVHLANQTGTDYVTGQTQNEQKVLQKEIERRVAEAEKDGKKLTAKERSKIEYQVERDMEKGYISTNTIEEVLGGETYQRYKKTVDSENALLDRQRALQEEFDALSKMKQGEMTGEQIDRRVELKEELAELNETIKSTMSHSDRSLLKRKLSQSVSELVSGDRLIESYNERVRKTQDFKADLSKYKSESAKKTVQNIIDSGLANDSNEFHDFVDLLTNISEGRGTVFRITDNDQLKGTEHYREGFITDGFITSDDGSITINLDSPKALNFIVGHEVTHSLETSNFYKDLQSAVFQYAEDKGELSKYIESVDGRYKSLDQTGKNKEVTSDLVGRYLFTDHDFISNLSTNHRNVFQKVFDEIKYLCKMATAGSKAARDLERVKHQFEKAYRETKAKTDANYSLTPVDAVQPTSSAWMSGANTDEVRTAHPTLYAVDEDATETRNPTQVKNTVSSYRKVYSYLQDQGFDGKILDASSGLGLGTQAGIEEFGFNVEDIEPYPDKDYKPKYTDYSALDEKYDAIISNAVLNVIPQDQRDALVTKMGQMLNPGGKMFINVRGKDVLNSSGKIAINEANMEYFIPRTAKTGSYQKGFTTAELKAYLEDALGDEFEVTDGRKVFGTSSPSAIVTRKGDVKVLEGGSVTKYSLSTWTPDMQKKVSRNLVKAGFEQADVDKWIEDTNGIAAVIASDRARLDFEAHENHTMVKDNNEYYKTVEASTLCAKRLEYQGTFDAIQHRLPNTTLTSDMLIELREMMKKHGREVPCGACYVESRRRHLGRYATDWLKTYDGAFIPTLADVTTTDGLERLRIEHPDTYNDFVAAMNKKGVSNPKVVELRTEYKGEIMKIPNSTYQKIMKIGGLRLQSFSDFETPHLLDMMQVVHDMASRKFVSQAYTKVPNFAWVLGDTNIKINLSLIPGGTGIDANGELIFDPKEGMGINEAMRLRDRYSKNVGTTIIGINDAHILKCMADDRIDYIIPFHRSGWGSKELTAMGLDSYVDYTKQQRERDIATGKGVDNIDEMSYWDFSKTGKENAEAYLELCAERGVIPKFEKFLVDNGDGSYSLQPDGSTDGYWKTLINFKMYDNDGVGSPHQAVVPNFNMEEAYRVLNEYEGGANSLPVAKDVVEEFVAKYEETAPTQYSLSKADTDYMDAVMNNDNETAQHLLDEAAKNAGYTIKAYHGTRSGEFFVFDKNRIGDNYSGYNAAGGAFDFSTDEDRAYRWGDMARGLDPIRTIPVYLKAEKTFYNYESVPKDLESTLPEGITEAERAEAMSAGYAYRKILERYGIDFKQAITSMGYDSYSMHQGYENIAVYEPSQIKSADLVTTNPETGEIIPLSERFNTENNDIRYSLSEATDNEGNRLTREQEEFFKDSKIRDRDGNLRRVYHTTQNDFTVFDHARKGEATDGPNTFLGFFFAESPDHMTQFPEFQNGKTDSYYLDMKKPMDLTDLSKEAFMDIVELTGGDRFEAAEAYDQELKAEQARARLRGDSNTSLSISQLLYNMVGDYYHADFFDALKPNYDKLKAKGYDGVIDYLDEMMGEREFVVFDSNQAKLTSNTSPTSDPDIRYSESGDEAYDEYGNYNVYGKDVKLQPAVEDDFLPMTNEANADEDVDFSGDIPIKTVKERLTAKRSNSQIELDKNRRLREEASKSYDDKIAKVQAQLDSKKNKDTKVANNLRRRIERLKRLKADVDAQYAKRISDIETRISNTDAELQKDHTKQDQYERAISRINRMLEMEKADLDAEFAQKRELLTDKDSYISEKAAELYKEIRGLKKGVKASEQLGYLLDHGYDWSSIRSALVNIKHTPGKTVNVNSEAESVAREMLNDDFEQAHFNLDTEYQNRLSELESEAETKRQAAKVANQRMVKHQEYADQMELLIGDTSTWVDKKMGISYKVNTLRRNLRDIVRDAEGNLDIDRADAIYDELQGKYNHNEAMLHRESDRIKKPYADLRITTAEDAYIQMLGELRHNPDTTLTEDVVKEFYEKHKSKIDTAKVDRVIESARETYDTLLERVNEVLREQGMKEIPYRQGYFPHFTEPKQSWLAKLLNWKTKDFDIPTDIAGLTENFNPNRSWQAFNKQRKSDITDYSFMKGMDTYVQGALDWIYHIEDIQKRRAFENHIRYVHSEKGVQQRIDAIRNNPQYDADEMQEQIDLVYKEAGNPLNNFVTDFRAGTNTLANKKSSLDRGMEELVNRKVYSTMTNLSNRVTGNMVVGSFSSALTNFIPITQSWMEVSPVSSLRAMGDTIRSTVRDDGMIGKSDFLTNRLRQSESLYKTNWDKVSDKAAFMMEAIDSFTSQTVWRSRYLENISKGMSESEAIKNADQFAESVIAGRSRGNMPTIFDSKNPLIKTLTAFQLEVNNQYQYFFKDAPQDLKDKSAGKLIKGYATAFLGAYAYNALYSSLVGRDAAFDPIGIIEDLLKDLFGDDEEEPSEIILGLTDSLLEEVPFVGGLVGGGRIPISSALPYDGLYEAFKGTVEDVAEKDWSNLTKEWMNPLWYLAMPLGGGQIRKTAQGLSMFDDDLPIAGSYTNSGKLRFPVEDTPLNRIQAGMFGQYSSKNARDYFDNGRSPMGEKQIQEFIDADIPIRDYWEYRDGLKGLDSLDEKADYISDLDLPISTKNLFVNNISDRKNPIDLTGYDNYDSFDEFDFAVKNPEKYEIAQAVGGYENYMKYREDMKDLKLADKVDYVAGLNLTTRQKNILINGETDRKEPIDLTGYENFDNFEDFEYAKANPGTYAVSKAVAKDFSEFARFKDEINTIKEGNDSDTGITDKSLVADYIFDLDIDYGQKIILYRSLYSSKSDKSKYNRDIVEYLNSRSDLTYSEKKTILESLDFKVDSNGNVGW